MHQLLLRFTDAAQCTCDSVMLNRISYSAHGDVLKVAKCENVNYMIISHTEYILTAEGMLLLRELWSKVFYKYIMVFILGTMCDNYAEFLSGMFLCFRVSHIIIDEAHCVQTWGMASDKNPVFREAFSCIWQLRSINPAC